MNESSVTTGARKQKMIFKCVSHDRLPIVVAGDSIELGHWDLSRALAMQTQPLAQGGCESTAHIELPLGHTIEYKFVKQTEHGPRWEVGNNRRITVIPGLQRLDEDFRDQ